MSLTAPSVRSAVWSGLGIDVELGPVLDDADPPTVVSIAIHDEDIEERLIEPKNVAQTSTVWAESFGRSGVSAWAVS